MLSYSLFIVFNPLNFTKNRSLIEKYYAMQLGTSYIVQLVIISQLDIFRIVIRRSGVPDKFNI